MSADENLVTSYYAFDGHGSTRFLSDATGTATDFYAYDAFGNLIYKSGATANAYLYCGEQYDSDLGMYSLRARYMEPGRGRFWTQDDFEGTTQDPDSLHKYLYCEADPVVRIDPSGKFDLAEVAVAASISGTVDLVFTGIRLSRSPQDLSFAEVAGKLGISFGEGFATGLIGGVAEKFALRLISPSLAPLWQAIIKGTAGAFASDFATEYINTVFLHKPFTFEDAGKRAVVAVSVGAFIGSVTFEFKIETIVRRTTFLETIPSIEITQNEISGSGLTGALAAEGSHKALEEWFDEWLIE